MSSALVTVRSFGVDFDPLRDKTYQSTRLGGDIVDFLAWMELGGASPRTLDQYERDLARGALLYPNQGTRELDDREVMQIAKLYQPGERRVRLASWGSFYKWAMKTRRADRNPFIVLPAIKRAPRRTYDIFTTADIIALQNLETRDSALFQIMFDTGLRKAECRYLRFEAYRQDPTPDAPYGQLVLREGTKGGNERLVPVTAELASKLTDLRILEGLNPADFFWYDRPGGGSVIRRDRPIGEGSFHRWWVRCVAQTGLRYRNPHLTRHTFALRYLRAGGRLETLQLVLGHESIRTTADHYSHLDMRDVAVDMGLISALPLADLTD